MLLKDKRVSDILNSTKAALGEYDQLITDLKQRHNQRCQIHKTHTMAIIKHPSKEKLEMSCSLITLCFINIHGLRNMDQFDAGAISPHSQSISVLNGSERLGLSILRIQNNIKFLDRKIQAGLSSDETPPVKPLPKSEINLVNSQHFIVSK